jgi:hypothetical protein
VNLIGMVLQSPLNPLAPLFRVLSLLTVVSLLWHRRWVSLGMMAASMLIVPLVFMLARTLLSGAVRMAVLDIKRRAHLV